MYEAISPLTPVPIGRVKLKQIFCLLIVFFIIFHYKMLLFHQLFYDIVSYYFTALYMLFLIKWRLFITKKVKYVLSSAFIIAHTCLLLFMGSDKFTQSVGAQGWQADVWNLRNLATLMATISANGNSLPPSLIFKGKWIPRARKISPTERQCDAATWLHWPGHFHWIF